MWSVFNWSRTIWLWFSGPYCRGTESDTISLFGWVGGYCIRAQVTKLSLMLIFSKLGTASSLIYILMGGLVNHTKSSNFCQEMQVFRHSSYSNLCLNLIFQVGLHITYVLIYFLLMFLYAWIFNQMRYPHVIPQIMWSGLDWIHVCWVLHLTRPKWGI